jgi:hypothetical protein
MKFNFHANFCIDNVHQYRCCGGGRTTVAQNSCERRAGGRVSAGAGALCSHTHRRERAVVTKRINRGSRDHVNPCAHRDVFLSQAGRQAEQQRAHTHSLWHTTTTTYIRGGRGVDVLLPVVVVAAEVCNFGRGCYAAAAAAAARGARPTSIVSEISEIESLVPRRRVRRPFLVVAFAAISEICCRTRRGGCSWCGGRAAVVVANSAMHVSLPMWVLRVPKFSVPKV